MSRKYIFDFKKNTEIKNPLRVFFLCGSKYQVVDSDKRNVLSKHLNTKSKNYKSIILEKNFIFTSKNKKKIKYVDDLKLHSLKDIEVIVSMLSDQIFIIHETLSTAAELGLFTYNYETLKKITVLNPDYKIVEENFISGFLKFSYNNSHYINNNVNIIEYKPVVELKNASINKKSKLRKYHTSFLQNEIDDDLSKNIDTTLEKLKNVKISTLSEKKMTTPSQNYYYVKSNNGKIILTIDTVKSLILSLLSQKKVIDSLNRALQYRFIDPLRYEIKKKATLYNTSIKAIKYEFTKLIKYEKSIAMFKISDVLYYFFVEYLKNYLISLNKDVIEIKIEVRQSEYSLKQFIHFYIYMLSIFKFIDFKKNLFVFKTSSDKFQYMGLSKDFRNIVKAYNPIIKEIKIDTAGEF